MGVNRGTLPIVLDKLVFNADPFNTACYPGTGTVLSNNLLDKNAGDISGATFDEKSFSYDGSNDYIEFAQPNANMDAPIMTIEMWFNPNSEHNGCLYMSRNLYDSGTNGCQILWRSDGKIIARGGGTTAVDYGDINSGGEVVGKWTQLVFTFNSTTANLYVNGSPSPSTNLTVQEVQVSTQVACVGCGTADWGRPYDFNGKIGPIRIYHKILTTAEMLQNYNSTKTRFGL